MENISEHADGVLRALSHHVLVLWMCTNTYTRVRRPPDTLELSRVIGPEPEGGPAPDVGAAALLAVDSAVAVQCGSAWRAPRRARLLLDAKRLPSGLKTTDMGGCAKFPLSCEETACWRRVQPCSVAFVPSLRCSGPDAATCLACHQNELRRRTVARATVSNRHRCAPLLSCVARPSLLSFHVQPASTEQPVAAVVLIVRRPRRICVAVATCSRSGPALSVRVPSLLPCLVLRR